MSQLKQSPSGFRVLVTGAAVNTGKAIVTHFARQGAMVFLHDRQFDAAEAAACEIASFAAPGARLIPIAADLSDRAQIDALFARVAAEAGGLDALICNAAHQGIGGPFLDTSLDLLESVLRVNVIGGFHCAQAAARLMRPQGSGSIVFLGSTCSERPIRNRSAYVASKGALDALSRALAVELGPLGIRVNLVAPGYIWSDRWNTLAPATAKRRRANTPLGNEATPGQIAAAVYYLSTENSTGVTGARLVIDGGSSSQLFPADCDG
jgi:NAD(P)-dependent dehydrogenase (short-subunit alcohol dehydrogenase family)